MEPLAAAGTPPSRAPLRPPQIAPSTKGRPSVMPSALRALVSCNGARHCARHPRLVCDQPTVVDVTPLLFLDVPPAFFFFVATPLLTVVVGTAEATGGGAVWVGAPVFDTFLAACSAFTLALTARYRLYSVPSSLWMSASSPLVVFFFSSFVPLAFFALRKRFMSCGKQ